MATVQEHPHDTTVNKSFETSSVLDSRFNQGHCSERVNLEAAHQALQRDTLRWGDSGSTVEL